MTEIGQSIRRYVAPDGAMWFSIRVRSDGNYQIVHDGAHLEDGSQPYWMEDRVMSGLFADADMAEEELMRTSGHQWKREV